MTKKERAEWETKCRAEAIERLKIMVGQGLDPEVFERYKTGEYLYSHVDAEWHAEHRRAEENELLWKYFGSYFESGEAYYAIFSEKGPNYAGACGPVNAHLEEPAAVLSIFLVSDGYTQDWETSRADLRRKRPALCELYLEEETILSARLAYKIKRGKAIRLKAGYPYRKKVWGPSFEGWKLDEYGSWIIPGLEHPEPAPERPKTEEPGGVFCW